MLYKKKFPNQVFIAKINSRVQGREYLTKRLNS